MSYSFSFSLVFTSWFTVVPVLKKKGNFLRFGRKESYFKRNRFLDFHLPEATFKLPQKNIFFRIHNYVNKDFYPFSDPRSDSRTLTKRTGLPILQLTVIAFVVSAFVFAIGAFLLDRRLVKVPVFLKALSPVYAIGAFLLDRRLVKVPVFLKALSPVYEDGLSRTNLMLEPVKIY